MSKSTEKPLRTPYIPIATALSKADVERHVERVLHGGGINYYGPNPGDEAKLRKEHPPIWIEDDSGAYPFSVSIAGSVKKARTLMIKEPSWSDHPGRDFETLRQVMIANPAQNLAVIGVSLPGAGLNSPAMTERQKESLRYPGGSFALIGAQQWEAIKQALMVELGLTEKDGWSDAKAEQLFLAIIGVKDFILSGSSLGSSLLIGMLESKPDWAHVTALGMAEPTDMASHTTTGIEEIDYGRHLIQHGRFIKNYMQYGGEHFDEYTAVNPYNNWSALGPNHYAFFNAARRPASHIGKVIGVLVSGNAAQRTVAAINEKGLKNQLHIKIRSGREDKLCPPAALTAAAVVLSAVAEVDQYAHPRHYHPYLENLANAQAEFRGFTR